MEKRRVILAFKIKKMERFNFKKKYGQNFLQDKNILQNIANEVNVQAEDLIIEIGAGSGNLSSLLFAKQSYCIFYEIDSEAVSYLTNYNTAKTKVILADFLKQNIMEDIKEYNYNNLYIVGNLPYYITTPIIEKIINSNLNIKNMILMVQKEVGDRLTAEPGSKQYGALTILLNYYFDIQKIIDVKRTCFYPIPNVDSCVLSFKMNDNKNLILNKELFFQLVRDSFQFKRKTIKNNLKKYDLNIIEQVLRKYNQSLETRAESIKIETFIEITNKIGK